MKLRDFIEALQQLDQDADVRVQNMNADFDPKGETWVEPTIKVKMFRPNGQGYSSERRTVCIQ